MDNLGLCGKGAQLAGDSVVESRSYGYQQIAVVYRIVCCIAAVHSNVSEIQRVIRRYAAFAHYSGNCRNSRLLHQMLHVLLRAGYFNSASQQEQRLLRLVHHGNGSSYLALVYLCRRLVAPDMHLARVCIASQLSHNVLRQVQQNRTGTACCSNIECFLHQSVQIITGTNHRCILADISCETDNVDLLECVVSNEACCNLSGKTNQWNAVQVCIGYSRNKICGSRAACDKTDAGFTR